MKRRSGFLLLMLLIIIGLTFCKKDPALEKLLTSISVDFPSVKKAPTVTTEPATNISATGATLNGKVNANYSPTIVTFEYDTTTIYGHEVTAEQSPIKGNASTKINATVTGLKIGTYHFRVKAENSEGTVYGDEIQFAIIPLITTDVLPTLEALEVKSVTCVSAYLWGKITDLGNIGDTMRKGWCWSTIQNPTINDNKIFGGLILNSLSWFGSTINCLNSGTTYYVRAFATNGNATSYSNQLSFTTSPSIKPTINNDTVRSISCTGAIAHFDISDDGGNPITERGACWATSAGPTTANNKGFTEGFDRSFRSEIDGLQPATLYHVRAYFITSAGTFYGKDISFTTNPKPTIKTTGVADITRTTVKVMGNITSTGGSFVVERGFCFNIEPNPIAYESNPYVEQEVQSCAGAGEFTISLTNLTPGTTYYVRSFVGVVTGNGYGDQLFEYGNEVTFNTQP